LTTNYDFNNYLMIITFNTISFHWNWFFILKFFTPIYAKLNLSFFNSLLILFLLLLNFWWSLIFCVFLTQFRKCLLHYTCISPRQPDTIVITVKNRVKLSHETVSDDEHFFLDVHFHDCRFTNPSRTISFQKISRTLICFYLNLRQHLWANWSHFEFQLLRSLCKTDLLRFEEPFFRREGVLSAVDD